MYPPMLTDEELAAKIQQGDRAAFEVLFKRYEAKILRYGQRFLYRYEDVEDAVQEVFVKAYVNIQSFTVSRKFSTWLYRVAHNTFINVIKKKGREPLSFFDFDTLMQMPVTDGKHLDEEFLKMGDQATLLEGLKKLSPKYREPLVLYYLEELDYKEIADVLQIPVSTVGVRLQRAKVRLKKELDTAVGPPPRPLLRKEG